MTILVLDDELMIEIKKSLSNHFKIIDLREIHSIVGIKVIYDKAHNLIKLSQGNYIRKILEYFSI